MKKILSIFLILIMVFSLTMFASAAEFTDISNSKNEEAIEELYDLGLIEGYGSHKFGPNKTLTRAEAATLVVRAMIKDDMIYMTPVGHFNDVSRDSWYKIYVDTAYRNDLMHGHGHNRFDPNSEITYVQFKTLVLNMLGYSAPRLPGTWPSNVNEIADYLDLDYNTSYYDNNDPIEREDAAQMIFNALSCYMVEYKNGIPYETDTLFRDLFDKDLSDNFIGIVTTVLQEGGKKENRYIAHFWMYNERGEWVEIYDVSFDPIHEKDVVWISYNEDGELEKIEVIECVEPEENPAPEDPIVYIVPNGRAYHMDKNCEYLKEYQNDLIEHYLSEVNDFTPCDKCVQ